MTPAEMDARAADIWGARWKMALADAAGVTRQTVFNWSVGRAPIPADLPNRIDAWIDVERARLAACRTSD